MIAHKKLHVLFLGVIILLCMVIPVSASPSLEDAYISYSVKGYYSQYLFKPAYQTYTAIDSQGNITAVSRYSLLSDYFEVTPGGSFGLFYNNELVYAPIYSCFYDSNYNVISGGVDNQYSYVWNVPSGASYCRISQGFSSNIFLISADVPFTSQNYTYLFKEIDNITINNGLISIPYQAYSYTEVFVDLEFYTSSYYLTNFGFDVYTYFSSSLSHLNNVPNVYLDENVIELYTYHYDHGEKQFIFRDDSISNPTYFDESFNNRQPFSGFRLYIPVSYNDALGSVSTSLQIELSNFYVDSKEAVYSAEADKIVDDKGEVVSGLIDDLAFPTPNTTDLFSGMDDVVQAVNSQQFSTVISAMWQNGIIPLFMLLSVSFSVLGYILFGKTG